MNQINPPTTARHRIGFIQARWHADIIDRCRESFEQEIARMAGVAASIDIFDVPGAFEIPLFARTLAHSAKFDAVVASALVVDGGIYRHEFVATAVINGLMQVQLETDVPVFSAVLTPHHFHETPEHKTFFLDHFQKKGVEVARACLSTLELASKFSEVS